MVKKSNKTDSDQALRKRLRQLLDDHSQAEIARKVGVSRSHVSRYLSDVRIPSSFCAALVRELGVNANWLLNGDGTPYAKDNVVTTSDVAADLVNVVHSMNVVSKMKLGAVAADSRLKIHRQVGDALEAHEQLQGTMEQRTSAVLSDLLDKAEAALSQRKRSEVQSYLETAERVQKLSGNEALKIRWLVARGSFEGLWGSFEEGHRYLRQAFHRELSRSETFDQGSALNGFRLAHTLMSCGRIIEARSITRAALALLDGAEAQGELRNWTHILSCLDGHITGVLGDLRSGLADIHTHFHQIDSFGGTKTLSSWLINAQLFAKVRSFEEALVVDSPGEGSISAILRFACTFEDPEMISRACKAFVGTGRKRLPENTMRATHALCLEMAFDGKKKKALTRFDSCAESPDTHDRRYASPEDFELLCDVYRAQICRYAGERARGQKLVMKSERAIRKNSRGFALFTPFLAIHYLNVRDLVSKRTTSVEMQEARVHAKNFFVQSIAKGYAAFTAMSD